MSLKSILLATGIATLMTGVTAFPLMAKYHEPDNTTRILWDLNSKKVIFDSGNYARLIPLADGRLMAAAESGGGISVSYSNDEGYTWSTPERIIQNEGNIPYAVPDLLQLSDGTILVGFNPRPSQPYSEERKFGIRTMRSTDNGTTWEGPYFIYDASHLYSDGCWEPSFLEIPGSGEVHCYFANEFPFQSSNEQEISVSRSFDGGVTWSEAERVCYRGGCRDGMPSAVITDSGEIVVIVEDNGYPRGFHATTIRCTLDQNWDDFWVDATSPNRHVIFADNDNENMQWISAAPYLRKLRSGETIASWQGDHWGREGNESAFDMFVAVGDRDARNFTQISEPFKLPANSHALWNSINVGNGDDVFALASVGNSNSGNAINLMKGYAMRNVTADFGTPVIDGSTSGDKWTFKNGTQIYLGAMNTRNRATADFLYDNDNLYFFARVVDRDIFTDKIDNDGVYLYLDTKSNCDTYPQDGEARIFFNVDGSIQWSYGLNGKWVVETALPEGVVMEKNISKTYYQLEAAIPWKALGLNGAAGSSHAMRCNVEIRDRREGELVSESIPQTSKNASWTWPEFRLNDSDPSGIVRPTVERGLPKIDTVARGGTVTVRSSEPISSIEAFNPTGYNILRKDFDKSLVINEATLETSARGLLLMRVTLTDCSTHSQKVLIR